ncbi:MAG: HAD family phosphatase [Thermodesulfobacteriota bacterium]|nr:HAD family phosphatase [Thermodesulfobacteriota bacterium]
MGDDAITTVVFDLGGVLLELSGIRAVCEWTEGRMTPEALMEQWLVSPAVRGFESGQTGFVEFREQLKAELGIDVSDETFDRTYRQWIRGMFPGTEDLLSDLAARYRVACFSNTNEVHWEMIENELGLLRFFHEAFVSFRMGLVKPDAAAFQHVLDGLGCTPGKIVFLDDSAVNTTAAEAFGMHARRVYGAHGARAALEEMGVL